MGQYTYDDDMFSPRWKAWHDYTMREREQNAVPHESTQRFTRIPQSFLVVLILLGAFTFLISTGSLAIMVMLLEETSDFSDQFSKIKSDLDFFANVGKLFLNISDKGPDLAF